MGEHITAAAENAAGSGLEAERERRLGRLEAMRSEGVEPYPYRFDRTHRLVEIRESWGDLEPGVEVGRDLDEGPKQIESLLAREAALAAEVLHRAKPVEVGGDRLEAGEEPSHVPTRP